MDERDDGPSLETQWGTHIIIAPGFDLKLSNTKATKHNKGFPKPVGRQTTTSRDSRPQARTEIASLS